MKPNLWWELINTPRKAVCWLILLVSFVVIATTKLTNVGLTDAQLFLKFWMWYAAVVVAMVIAYVVYPKH